MVQLLKRHNRIVLASPGIKFKENNLANVSCYVIASSNIELIPRRRSFGKKNKTNNFLLY